MDSVDHVARRNRSPRQAVAAMPDELQARWRARYCPNDEVDLRARALVERMADEMRAARDEATIRTVWMTLVDRCPGAPDDQVLHAAGGDGDRVRAT